MISFQKCNFHIWFQQYFFITGTLRQKVVYYQHKNNNYLRPGLSKFSHKDEVYIGKKEWSQDRTLWDGILQV